MNQFIEITEEEYRADKVPSAPTLNYSTAKTILQKSALHAWTERAHPRPTKKAMDMGAIIHSVLLSKGAKAQIVDAKDWRTNKAKAERDEARDKGLIPLLPDEYDKAMRAASAIVVQLEAQGIQLEGRSEQAMTWTDDGVACRGKMDLYAPKLITELKMSEWSLRNSSLERLVVSCGYDLQAATYITGVHAIIGEAPEFRWIFAEMNEPFSVVVAHPTNLLVELGRRKWDKARDIWKACLETGEWTSYDAVQTINPPLWALREYEISVYDTPQVIGDQEYEEAPSEETWF